MSELWFKCQNCGSNVRIVVQMSGLWFKCRNCGYKWDGWDGLDGWDLCAGLFYEHRFAMLIIDLRFFFENCIYNGRNEFYAWSHFKTNQISFIILAFLFPGFEPFGLFSKLS